ncbi:MAG TPA: hypothetical protein DD618_03170 [Acholeplasmatales bacterium]|nr:hypothetical protein [Acholeplasmatales bacterium]
MKISWLIPKVQAVLETHQPIIALESAIVSHGLSYLQNLQTALRIEDLIRSEHAVFRPHICLNKSHRGSVNDYSFWRFGSPAFGNEGKKSVALCDTFHITQEAVITYVKPKFHHGGNL